MFERFTERARQVVVLGQEEARALKHGYIGTEHLLLGLLREEEGLAARALESLGITSEPVRAQVVRMVGPGEEVVSDPIPFTPRAKNVCEGALREALSLGHNYIGTEHILLGLTRENGGVAARIFPEFDADSEKIRNEVIRMLSGPASSVRKAGTERKQPAPNNYSYYGDYDVRRFRHFRGSELTVLEGTGEKGDPFREVLYFFDEDGRLITRRDTLEEPA